MDGEICPKATGAIGGVEIAVVVVARCCLLSPPTEEGEEDCLDEFE